MATVDEDIEKSRAPLLDHLNELRTRLIICAGALVVGFVISFIFVKPIFTFLIHPYQVADALMKTAPEGGHGHFNLDFFLALVGLKAVALDPLDPTVLQATAPLEVFFTNLKISAFSAVAISFPVIAYQLYRFIAPGLYKRERKAFLPFLIASPILFMLGAALVYYVMLPFVMWFSLSLQISDQGVSVALIPKVSDYMVLVTRLLLAFGLCFQLPVVLTLAGLAGLIGSKILRKGRRYAIVAVFVVAAVVTPPDPFTQLALAVPLCLLYEVSIWCVWLVERRREAEMVAEDLAGSAL